tara:strand:+ start:660 stop:1262 length:603 start_codon:yes stop_codon:yes gene_type:complete
MTNIIETIEKNSLKNNSLIKSKATEILESVEKYGSNKTELSSDAFRQWVATDGKEFKFLFDEKGKKGKLVMSQHSKNISNGLMAIYKTEFVELDGMFTNWCTDETYKKGKNVSSFTKMSSNLTAYKKYLFPSDDDKNKKDENKKDENEKETIKLDDLPSNEQIQVLFEKYNLDILTNDIRDILEKVIKSKFDENKKAVNQ